MSFIPDPELALGSACYYNGLPMFIFAQQVATTKTGTKVQYQVTEQLPDDYTNGKGQYPQPLAWYDRTEIETPADWYASELARIEGEANDYYRTLTGKPYIWLLGDATETFIIDTTSNDLYADAGLYISDIEDGTTNVVITDTTSGPISDTTALVVDGTVDLQVEGVYLRDYVATDSGGFVSDTVTRTINVILEPPPEDLPNCQSD